MKGNKHNINCWKNDKKETDNHPDFKGWDKDSGDNCAIWVKTDRNGNKYLSVSFEPGATKEQAQAHSQQMAKDFSDFDAKPAANNFNTEFEDPDSIPF